jgi:hypothetical protein
MAKYSFRRTIAAREANFATRMRVAPPPAPVSIRSVVTTVFFVVMSLMLLNDIMRASWYTPLISILLNFVGGVVYMLIFISCAALLLMGMAVEYVVRFLFSAGAYVAVV